MINSLCRTWTETQLERDRNDWELLPEIAGGGHKTATRHGKVPAMLIPLCIATAWLIVCGLPARDFAPPTAPTRTAEPASRQPIEPLERIGQIPSSSSTAEVFCRLNSADRRVGPIRAMRAWLWRDFE